MVDGRDNAWRSRAPGPHARLNTARQVMDGLWTEVCGQQKQSNDPRQQPAQPQDANYWAPLTRKRHTMPHPAQPRHTNRWAPRTRKRHQQEHRPQRSTESRDPTQHAKGRTGDCPGPRKETTTRRNVTRGALQASAGSAHDRQRDPGALSSANPSAEAVASWWVTVRSSLSEDARQPMAVVGDASAGWMTAGLWVWGVGSRGQ